MLERIERLCHIRCVGGRVVGKVTAFVTRRSLGGPEVLVFDHFSRAFSYPPAPLEPGEDPSTGALREAWEETGLGQLELVAPLGTLVEEGEVVRHRHLFHLACRVGTADEWWVRTPDGDGLCWRCSWIPIGDAVLVDGQQQWLDRVKDRLAAQAAAQPAPVARAPFDPTLVNNTTVELFWAPPFGGRRVLRSWLDPGELDPAAPVARALGVCFDSEGQVVLVSLDGSTDWNHPGGGVEPAESPGEALCREVAEEACGRVLHSTLLGYERAVEIDDWGHVLGVEYQARYAAEVALETFAPRHETVGRMTVDLQEVPARLHGWQPDILQRLLERARLSLRD